MTLVVALKINPSTAIMASDGCIGLGNLTYNLGKKIDYIKPILVGHSGVISQSNRYIATLEKAIQSADSLDEICDNLSMGYSDLWREEFEKAELGIYDLTIEDLIKGAVENTLRTKLLKKLEEGRPFSPTLLFCGHDSEGNVGIYKLNQFNRNIAHCNWYESIGCGYEICNNAVYMRYSSDFKGTINEKKAIETLVMAFAKSGHIKGVNRYMEIHRLDEKGHKKLSEENCNILMNSYLLKDKGVLSKKAYKNIINSISFKRKKTIQEVFNKEINQACRFSRNLLNKYILNI